MQKLVRDAGLITADGKAVSLLPQIAGALRTPYEKTLFEKGEMGFRERNWHDFFNVLACVVFPLVKSALNARHYAALGLEAPGKRGSERDALTLFDESGVIVLGPRHLLAHIRAFEWHELFWRERESVCRDMRFFIFGHALYEKSLEPYVGMTGHALLVETDSLVLREASDIDAHVAGMIRSRVLDDASALSPLPLLGIPGWWRENENEQFYANERYFRRGRSRKKMSPDI